MERLIKKYNRSGPRYTSYPTVPFWDSNQHDEDSWKQSLFDSYWRSGKEVSIYVHLPFCESLCTYCGCTTRITKNHKVEETYISYLKKEWGLYKAALPSKPIIKEIHLGGGTPTFFSANNLKKLISILKEGTDLSCDFEFGFEGHPGNTTEEHLQTLSQLGFKRISLGIQDFNPEVQKTINRKQSFEQVEKVVDLATKHGFTSINFDLIYGLPKQTSATVSETIRKTIQLKPTRIAFYGYAHVPWIKASQKSFERFLPTPEERAQMYQLGKRALISVGYNDIGMDHFALKEDSLFKAFSQGALHRNFMGYTTQETDLLIGLGMSAISDSWTAFSQNTKLLTEYYELLDAEKFPIKRGHQLTTEDLLIRRHILNLMCKFRTNWSEEEFLKYGLSFNLDLLIDLANDNLIEWDESGITVLEKGKPFIRNICMALDAHLWNSSKQSRFSQTV